jgi:hypoxanthine phosphoribosyltransferase
VIEARDRRRHFCIAVRGNPITWERTLTPVQSDFAFAGAGTRHSWLGPPLRILTQPEFDASCAQLMRLVEQDYAPSLIVGIRTGGLVVAECMARYAPVPPPILPVTSRRASTDTKSSIPLLRTTLGALPRPAVNLLRRVEHRLLIATRASRRRPQTVDHDEIDAIADWVGRRGPQAHILVADDAVDSGVTLATVVSRLAAACRSGTEIRTAVITQTLERPVMRPDYALLQGTLCRFPWSFDAHR